MANPTYFEIQTDYQAYQDLIAAGAPGVDGDLDAILTAMADLETTHLIGWSGLHASYGWPPAQLGTPCPVIFGVPVGSFAAASPFDQGDLGGFPGGMQEQKIQIDRFIAGGPESASILDAQRAAARLWLPLNFLYAKNGMLGGVVHGAKITGATWQRLPLGQTTWIGLAVHLTILCYYQLKAS